MAASVHFDRISRHFRSICNFYFVSQNGYRRPFWMPENHFLSHISPFQINTQLLHFFSQNGLAVHFGCSKNHFWSQFSQFQTMIMQLTLIHIHARTTLSLFSEIKYLRTNYFCVVWIWRNFSDQMYYELSKQTRIFEGNMKSSSTIGIIIVKCDNLFVIKWVIIQ